MIDEVIEMMEADVGLYGDQDWALLHLLKDNRDHLPPLDDPDWFHKAFRQTDVTGSANQDMAIWHLLKTSHLFWDVVNNFDI